MSPEDFVRDLIWSLVTETSDAVKAAVLQDDKLKASLSVLKDEIETQLKTPPLSRRALERARQEVLACSPAEIRADLTKLLDTAIERTLAHAGES